MSLVKLKTDFLTKDLQRWYLIIDVVNLEKIFCYEVYVYIYLIFLSSNTLGSSWTFIFFDKKHFILTNNFSRINQELTLLDLNDCLSILE